MLSPEQIDGLEEQRSKATTMIVLGWMLLVFGGVLNIFAPSDFQQGTHFIRNLAAVEGVLGLVVVAVGSLWRRSVLRVLDAHHSQDFEASAGAATAMGAGAGH